MARTDQSLPEITGEQRAGVEAFEAAPAYRALARERAPLRRIPPHASAGSF